MPLKIFKTFFSNALVFYLCVGLLVWHMADFEGMAHNAIPQTMSRLTPPMDYFAEFVDRKGDYDRFKLMNCINYHEAVIRFFPYQKAEALGMIGFCQERLGRLPQAIDAYTRSIAENPDYFWPYYDLGAIYYNEGRFDKAVQYFHQALEIDPTRTVVMLFKSKVYNDVRLSRQHGDYDYVQALKEGRIEALMFLGLSLKAMGQEEAARAMVLQAAPLLQHEGKSIDSKSGPTVKFF